MNVAMEKIDCNSLSEKDRLAIEDEFIRSCEANKDNAFINNILSDIKKNYKKMSYYLRQSLIFKDDDGNFHIYL